MEPLTMGILGAMQGVGMVTSIFSAHQNEKLIKLGRKLEQAQFETNMQAIQTASMSESVDEMIALRKNIGSQVVSAAVRGNKAGAAIGIGESLSNFESDERKRRMNLLMNENELRAGNVLSSLNLLKSETQLGQSLISGLFDTVPTTSLFKPQPAQKSAAQGQKSAAQGLSGGSLTGGY